MDPAQAHFLLFFIFSLPSAWGVQGCMTIKDAYVTFFFVKNVISRDIFPFERHHNEMAWQK